MTFQHFKREELDLVLVIKPELLSGSHNQETFPLCQADIQHPSHPTIHRVIREDFEVCPGDYD